MISTILEYIAVWISGVIETWSYGGIVLLMGIESMCIPLPSELIMPFAGYLVYAGKMNFWLAGLAGGIGCLIGSLIAYAVGFYGGRPIVEKYGKYILISKKDLDMADDWFAKYGDDTAFWSRLLPIIRTFISLPLGIAKVNIWKFAVYSLIGSIFWSLFLVYLGMKFGENWHILKDYFHEFDLVIGIILVFGLGWYVYRHMVNIKK